MQKVSDFQVDGKWAVHFRRSGKDVATLGGSRWRGMLQRCSPTGMYQQLRPSYVGVTHSFADSQDFITWARLQTGYFDTTWQLDKDLLVKGNKEYCKNGCIFLPPELNAFLLQRTRDRGLYPIGVTRNKISSTKPFTAQIGKGVGQKGMKHIGIFSTPEAAFEAYRVEKTKLAREKAARWKDIIDPRAYAALQTYEVNIND